MLVGKYFDSLGMAAVDQFFRQDRPVRVERVGLGTRGHGVKARDELEAEASGGSRGRSPAAFRGRLRFWYTTDCRDQAVALYRRGEVLRGDVLGVDIELDPTARPLPGTRQALEWGSR